MRGCPILSKKRLNFLFKVFFCLKVADFTVFIKGLLKVSPCAFALGQYEVFFLYSNPMRSEYFANCLELNGQPLNVFTILRILNMLITLSSTGNVAFAETLLMIFENWIS